ncbi:hypothetical protein QBC45DRAFT_312168, partial [Copromyces sp. CBS 386.78]
GSTPGAAPAMCGSSPAEELAGGAQKVVAQAFSGRDGAAGVTTGRARNKGLTSSPQAKRSARDRG